MDPSIKEWFLRLETKVDRLTEIVIATQEQLRAHNNRANTIETTLKSHEMRLGEIERNQSKQDGGIRMLAWVGGVLLG